MYQVAKVWNFSFICPSNEYSGLIFLFRIDWFDFLAVQGTLKSLLQHHNLKAPILWHSAFFMIQLSHLYMTTGKTIALSVWGASQVSQMVKNLPAMRETRVQSLGGEDPLEKEMATHSSIFAWRILWTEEPDRLQSMGLQRVDTIAQLTLDYIDLCWQSDVSAFYYTV